MSHATQIEQGGTSRPAGEEVEEGDEASSMDISESMERPARPQRTPFTQGWERCHQRTEMDNLTDNMGTMPLNMKQRCKWGNKMPNFYKQYKPRKHNVGTDGFNNEQEPSFRQVLSPTKVSILS